MKYGTLAEFTAAVKAGKTGAVLTPLEGIQRELAALRRTLVPEVKAPGLTEQHRYKAGLLSRANGEK